MRRAAIVVAIVGCWAGCKKQPRSQPHATEPARVADAAVRAASFAELAGFVTALARALERSIPEGASVDPRFAAPADRQALLALRAFRVDELEPLMARIGLRLGPPAGGVTLMVTVGLVEEHVALVDLEPNTLDAPPVTLEAASRGPAAAYAAAVRTLLAAAQGGTCAALPFVDDVAIQAIGFDLVSMHTLHELVRRSRERLPFTCAELIKHAGEVAITGGSVMFAASNDRRGKTRVQLEVSLGSDGSATVRELHTGSPD